MWARFYNIRHRIMQHKRDSKVSKMPSVEEISLPLVSLDNQVTEMSTTQPILIVIDSIHQLEREGPKSETLLYMENKSPAENQEENQEVSTRTGTERIELEHPTFSGKCESSTSWGFGGDDCINAPNQLTRKNSSDVLVKNAAGNLLQTFDGGQYDPDWIANYQDIESRSKTNEIWETDISEIAKIRNDDTWKIIIKELNADANENSNEWDIALAGQFGNKEGDSDCIHTSTISKTSKAKIKTFGVLAYVVYMFLIKTN